MYVIEPENMLKKSISLQSALCSFQIQINPE